MSTTASPARRPCGASRLEGAGASTTPRSATATCATCSPSDPTRGERLTAEGAGLYLDYSKNRVTDETLGLLLQLAEESGLRERTEAMFRGERINVSENRSVLHVALRMPRGESLVVDGVDVVARGARGPRPDGRVLRARPLGRVEGPHRQADPERRQHRHRRLRPRAGHGLRGAAPLHAARPDVPLRLERRLDRLRRGDPRPRRRRDALHRLLEDVHDARDDDERALGAGLGRSPQLGDEAAIAKHFVAVSTNAEEVVGVRHRHRQHVRLLGLGRRPLLDGLRDRPLDDARRRARRLPRDARRLPRDGRALPHDAVRAEPARAHGPARGLVRRLLRRPDRRRDAVQPVPEALPRLPPAADDGVERQARHARRPRASTTRPAPSSGASRAPTGSTASTSSSTRARSSSRST